MSLLTCVGFSDTTRLLTHQEGTGPEASVVQESKDTPGTRGPSMPILQLCGTWCLLGIQRAFPGDASYGGRKEGRKEGRAPGPSLSQH